jgi:metal-responsive CopG/Arc/MetJ family transcriptional regulator
MPVMKLGISFPIELVEEIDNISKGLKKSRSEVIRDAIAKMINDYKKKQVLEKAEKIYREIEEEDKRLAEDFLSICAEPVAEYKVSRKAKKR